MADVQPDAVVSLGSIILLIFLQFTDIILNLERIDLFGGPLTSGKNGRREL